MGVPADRPGPLRPPFAQDDPNCLRQRSATRCAFARSALILNTVCRDSPIALAMADVHSGAKWLLSCMKCCTALKPHPYVTNRDFSPSRIASHMPAITAERESPAGRVPCRSRIPGYCRRASWSCRLSPRTGVCSISLKRRGTGSRFITGKMNGSLQRIAWLLGYSEIGASTTPSNGGLGLPQADEKTCRKVTGDNTSGHSCQLLTPCCSTLDPLRTSRPRRSSGYPRTPGRDAYRRASCLSSSSVPEKSLAKGQPA